MHAYYSVNVLLHSTAHHPFSILRTMIYSRMKACFGILKAGAGNVADLATRGPYSRIQPQGATPSSSAASRRDPSRSSRRVFLLSNTSSHINGSLLRPLTSHGQAKTRRDSTEGLFKAHFPPAYVSGGGSNRSPRRHSSLPSVIAVLPLRVHMLTPSLAILVSHPLPLITRKFLVL